MYHVNPETGKPGTCKAIKSCPFGGADVHYTSPEAARAAYEASQTGAFSAPRAVKPKRVPAPKTKSEFAAAILQVIPKVEDSTVVPKPTTDLKEPSGAITYLGGSVSNQDAQGNYKYQGLKEAIAGVRQSITEARASGEIPDWITTTVKSASHHWSTPALALTVGFKGVDGKGAIPNSWLEKSGDRAQSDAGIHLAAYMERMARQFESSYSHLAIDEYTISNRGKVEWL